MGKIDTLVGKAHLLDIADTSKMYIVGEIDELQLIFVKDGNAYIMTGACLKEDRSEIYPKILETFHSFFITDNLLNMVKNEEKKELLSKDLKLFKNDNSKNNTKRLKNFQKKLEKDFPEMGLYWQLLLLAETQIEQK